MGCNILFDIHTATYVGTYTIALYSPSPGPGPIQAQYDWAINMCIYIFENNESSVNKMQMQRIGYVHILCIKVNVLIDTMLKFDKNKRWC